jgi:hypothetical protein
MRSLLLTVLTLFSAPVYGGEIAQQLRGVQAPTAVRTVLDSYPGGALSVPFGQQLTHWTRTQMAAAADRHLEQAKIDCKTQANVSFVSPGTFGTTEAERDFEESVFMVESVYCADTGTAKTAASIYSSRTFRTSAMLLVNGYSLAQDKMCLSTLAKAGLLKATSFCHQVQQFHGPTIWGLAGWLVENDASEDIQALYFRETIILFVDRPDGGVAGFRGVVTRSRDLGTLGRTVLRATVSGGHTRVEAALIERLNQER